MPSRVGRRELIELAKIYLKAKRWYLSLSPEERRRIGSRLKNDIEFLIRVFG